MFNLKQQLLQRAQNMYGPEAANRPNVPFQRPLRTVDRIKQSQEETQESRQATKNRFSELEQLAKSQRDIASSLKKVYESLQKFLRNNESELSFATVAKIKMRIRSVHTAMQSLMRGGLTTDIQESDLGMENASVQRIIKPKPGIEQQPKPGIFRIGGTGPSNSRK